MDGLATELEVAEWVVMRWDSALAGAGVDESMLFDGGGDRAEADQFLRAVDDLRRFVPPSPAAVGSPRCLSSSSASRRSSHHGSVKAASIRRNSASESQARAAKRKDTTTPASLLRTAIKQLHHHGNELLTVAPLDKLAPDLEEEEKMEEDACRSVRWRRQRRRARREEQRRPKVTRTITRP